LKASIDGNINLTLPTRLTLDCESIDYNNEKGDEVVAGSNGLPPLYWPRHRARPIQGDAQAGTAKA
jgi:hypothetical protein